jgi:hypothetical protein
VGLRPAAVVRLKRTLAHWNSRCGKSWLGRLHITTGTGGSSECWQRSLTVNIRRR